LSGDELQIGHGIPALDTKLHGKVTVHISRMDGYDRITIPFPMLNSESGQRLGRQEKQLTFNARQAIGL
jgi:hypothetical protein